VSVVFSFLLFIGSLVVAFGGPVWHFPIWVAPIDGICMGLSASIVAKKIFGKGD
jgi:hypothetical protein